MEKKQPVLFLSHGAGPSYYIDAKTMPMFKGLDKDSKAADFLRSLVKTHDLKKPEAILVISAHWEESVCTVNTNSKHSLYYDYYNFPPETYKLSWPVKGAPEVAKKVKYLLEESGISCQENSERGLDHGVFIPLILVYPEADIPGFDVFDDCGIPRNTMSRALDILDGPILGTEQCRDSPSVSCNIGIIGGSNSTTTEAMLYALRGSQLPVIGPYATYHNLTRYSNYYRTVPTDLQQIQATADLLRKLGLTYVAVVHTDDGFGRYSAKKLKEISKDNGICVDSIQTIEKGPDIEKAMLTQQRMRTKHNSLRVVYFGRRDIFRSMQIELGYSKEEMFNISWIVVENPEDTSPHFDSSSSLENGMYIISPTVNHVNALQQYLAGKFSSPGSPKDDIERLIRCLGDIEVSDISYKDIAATIDAVFVFASTLQRQTKLYCSSSMCDGLRSAFDFKLSEVQRHPVKYADIDDVITVDEFSDDGRSTSFEGNGEFLPNANMKLYDIFIVEQNNLTQIGEFRGNAINLTEFAVNNLDVMPSSICNVECAICENIPDISFAFLDGETFILGVFAVHETDPNDPFKCSKFRTFQMDVVIIEAFLFSVQQMRNETGIDFGAIVIDDCYSSAQTDLVLSQILSGEVTLTNPDTGKRIEVERIAAAVMTVSSSVTIPVGFLMTEKKIPVISASASSPDLDDRINFPYFLRTVPSDVEQARAMISIIKRMGWNYVSLLYVENNYGSKGKEAFVRLANESGICIADSPEGISDVNSDNSDSELISVFSRLNIQRADVVVYFGTEARIEEFLKVNNGRTEQNFIFLASEDWGDRQYILNIGKDRTLGSITLKNEVESLAGRPLEQHLRSLNPDSISHSRNPWFVEYWEEKFKCDLPQTFRHKFNNICDETLKFSDDNITEFVEDHRIVHTVVAVQALAHGLKKSQKEFCDPDLPQGNTFPCQYYFQYITDVVKNIREVEIARGGNDARVFKDDGNGNVGFKVNNVQKAANDDLDYVPVGTFAEGKLDLDDNKLKFYQKVSGDCFGTYCGHCMNGSFTKPVTIATTTHVHPETDDFAIPDYTIIGILGFLFVVIIVMTIIIICYFKRRIVELESQLKETKYEIRTGYALHNNSTFSHANTTSITYPEMKFVNTGPSGDSMYEWRKAQNVLNGGNSKYAHSNGGIVNQGFVGDMYLHATHDDDENQQSSSSGNYTGSPRGHTTNSDQINSLADSPVYKPPSTSYGLSSHSSFKKPADYNHNGQIKKQPRTQLAVPPCRPELPPRDPEQQRAQAQRPNGFTDKFEHMSPSVPKEKVRKVRSSPRRTVSPPSFKHSPEHSRYRDSNFVDSSKYNGTPSNMSFPDSKLASQNIVNLEGSMEKISRV